MFVHDLRVLNIGCSITAIKPHSGDLLQEKMMCDPKEKKKEKPLKDSNMTEIKYAGLKQMEEVEEEGVHL